MLLNTVCAFGSKNCMCNILLSLVVTVNFSQQTYTTNTVILLFMFFSIYCLYFYNTVILLFMFNTVFYGQMFVDFVGFLSMVIYIVSLYTQFLRYNICRAWFLDIRISTCLSYMYLYSKDIGRVSQGQCFFPP